MAISVGSVRCAAHPEASGIAACTRCGNFFCEPCAGYHFGTDRFCKSCDPGGPYVAWEDRPRLGRWVGFKRTLKPLLLSPDRFFHRMPTTGGYGRPLVFAWISTLISTITLGILYAALTAGMLALVPFPTGQAEEMPIVAVTVGVITSMVVVSGVLVPLALFAWAGLLHLTAKIFGAQGTFEGTFRCAAYASGALALGIVPFAGMSLGQVYVIVLLIFGVKRIHKVSGGRAAAIVLILPVLCCGLYFVSIFGLAFLSAVVGH